MADNNAIEVSEKHLTKQDLNKLWYRWYYAWFSSSSYEKLESHAFAYSYGDFAEKYYGDDKEKRAALLTRHSQFYNTEPQVGCLINGIVASIEEGILFDENVPEELPTTIKTTLMGPLAGLGDSVIQGIIVPTLLSIGMGLSETGSVAGPLFYIVVWLCLGVGLSYGLFRYGYKMGVGALDTLIGDNAMRIMDAINVLGVVVVGTLAASMVSLETIIQIPSGSEWLPLQDTLDGVFPCLLPLLAVLAAYWMLNKKHWNATKVLVIMVIAVVLLCLIGVL
jgi:mannose/fructose/N-acetylgalactosamine-specific phosphotransferase system component IID